MCSATNAPPPDSLAVPRPPRILVLYGTRPEAIKMAPVVHALRQRPDTCEVVVCAAGQHREMLQQVEQVFELRPDIELSLMRPDQTLNSLASRALAAFDTMLVEEAPDWILVQGDTTSAMTAGLAGFHRGIKVGHVEAGLRTGDLQHPFPEEANRRILDVFADALFAPTLRSRRLLESEGIDPAKIFLTGNTVVDALQRVSKDLSGDDGDSEGAEPGNMVLITAHRRESFGEPLREVFSAIAELAEAFSGIRWVYPVHRNPRVREPAHEILGGIANVELHEPFDYVELMRHMRASRLVLTDSGGLQEEAPSLGKPVLVLRQTTERPEGVDAGVARLVGTRREVIIEEVRRLLEDPEAYAAMANPANPYGDGLAAERIAAILTGRPWEPFAATA